ncbi:MULTISPECIES: hypothetical protein [unclassified Roseovarius]|uniref:hypothetical protein n=1 Tax=unclassified Roseovarius TaxID=2614913 RepID=UPI00273E67A4|nr:MULTISPECIES: hypothetical protein [unclassified Roseovarius]
MTKAEEPDALIDRIIKANTQIPAKGCRAQHAKHGGHHRATFKVHALDDTDPALAQGLFATPASYTAVIRYSNGKEQDAAKPDVHGMAIKIHADPGERLLTDPDDACAIDFVLVDVDTFFSDDLGDYTIVNEKLVPLLQRKQTSDDAFSFWEALGGLVGTIFTLRTLDDALRLFRFRGEKEPISKVKRWHLEYSSATPYRLGDIGPVKYKILACEATSEASVVEVAFCIERPSNPRDVDIEMPSYSWADVSDLVTVATLAIETDPGSAPDLDVEHLRFNPWHVPPEHEPLGAINAARKKVYDTLADKRQREHA